MEPTLPAARATIRDVSRLAGVSIKTVSRVINKRKYVTAETRARVEQVMAQLRPHVLPHLDHAPLSRNEQ